MALPWTNAKADARVVEHDEKLVERLRDVLLKDCHPWQRDAVADRHRRISLLVGRGGGKTTTIRAKLLLEMAERPRSRYVFIAPTREMAAEIAWDPLQDTLDKLKTQHAIDLKPTFRIIGRTLTLGNGSRLRFVGADDDREANKLRGQPFDGVAVDEVALFPDERLRKFIYRVIGPRLGERNGWLLLASTPGHILDGVFYEASRPDSQAHRPYADRDKPEFSGWTGWSSHRWTLEDVFKLPNAEQRYPALCNLWREALVEKKDQGWSDDNPVWLREYLGIWALDNTETVFRYDPRKNQWDPKMVRVGDFEIAELPPRPDWTFVVAVDQGNKDPCAITVFAASPSDPEKNIYQVFGFEKTQMYARPIATMLLGPSAVSNLDAAHDRPGGVIGAIGSWPAGMVIDGGEDLVAELANVYGLRFTRPKKTPEYKFSAIGVVNGDLVDGRLKILKGSTLEQQLQQLQWAKDEYGFMRENKAQANHSTDCLIYGRRLLADLFESGNVGESRPIKVPYRDPMQLDDSSESGGEYDTLLSEQNYAAMWGNE